MIARWPYPIGTASGVDHAGPTDPPGPPGDRRPTIPAAVIADRALAWHRGHMGSACDCTDEGRYPCDECRREVLELEALLDTVVRDTIRVVMAALERIR